jgi:hypothetical protein
VDINIGPHLVATYVWDDAVITRPYFANVCALDGTPVTRSHPPDAVLDKGNDDHATFHPGLWLAFGDVSGADVWRLKSRVRHVDFKVVPRKDQFLAGFRVSNSYETLEVPAKMLADEVCDYTVVADNDGYFLFSRSTFTAKDEPIVFGDQEEMGFGVRLATGISVKRGGSILNSNGGVNEAGTWGKSALWCSAYGPSKGETAGIVLMPGPSNFRASWFHSRDYGLVVANPFAKKSMTAPEDPDAPPDKTVVEPGKTLQLEFGVYVFSNAGGSPPDAAGKYQRFTELLHASKH